MNGSTLQEYLHLLAQRHGWREVSPGYEYLGLHRGITVHAVEYGGTVTLLFFALEVKVDEEARVHFSGFRHWAEAGLPSSWLQAREGDPHSCVLRIDRARLTEIGPSRALLIPDLIARDFHAHGALEEITCRQCQKAKAVTTVLIDSVYSALCDPCRGEVQTRAAAERRKAVKPVLWARVLPILLVFSLAGAWLWSQLQLQAPGASWLFLGPMIYGWVVCTVVLRSGTGSSFTLRLVLLGSVLIVVLAGNVWAYKVELVGKKELANWRAALWGYFIGRFRERPLDEMALFLGAFLGYLATLALENTGLRERSR